MPSFALLNQNTTFTRRDIIFLHLHLGVAISLPILIHYWAGTVSTSYNDKGGLLNCLINTGNATIRTCAC